MKAVVVKVCDLLDKLRENREGHMETFEYALQGYREMATTHLGEMLEDARSGKPVRRSLEILEPVCHLGDYDRAIAMLEMTTEEQIEISARDFDRYVLDNWEWRADFDMRNSSYTVSDD
jgi:hypothetical protein